MTRNTIYRVEVAVEILNEAIREKLLYMLQILDSDNVKARYMNSEGAYHRVLRRTQEPQIDSQRALYQYFAQEKVIEPSPVMVESSAGEEDDNKSWWTRLKDTWQK